jgi:putative acetyltransferase
LRTSGVRVESVDPQGPDALALLREAAIEARALYPELFTPNAQWPTNVPTPERGTYLIAYSEDQPVACGAFRPLEQAVAEVRRMFVTRSARRRGLAKIILQELELQAREFGYTVLRLETGVRQSPAMALYESCGFRRIPPFGEYINDPTSVCFEKQLACGPSQSGA